MIPSGNYEHIEVAGDCTVPLGGSIRSRTNIDVRSGASLDAQRVRATITVDRNVTVQSGALLGLGCQPASPAYRSGHPCIDDPDGETTIRVNGNVTATNTATVMLNGISVGRNVTVSGGGSMIPWTIMNSHIGGNVTVTSVSTDWLGVLFNHVDGNVTLTGIELSDAHPGSPGVFVGLNAIGRNLTCQNLTILGVPGVASYGNTVGGRSAGQCAT